MVKIEGWKKTHESKNKQKIIWRNNNSEIICGITCEAFWIVIINKKFKQSFTTKTKALNYAISYMKAHPRG